MDTQDVPAGSSPAPASVGVTDGRPIQNVVGEFNRKFGELNNKVETLVNYLASREAQASQPPPQASQAGNTRRAELFARAQHGDPKAFEEYQTDIAQEVIQRERKVTQREQLVDNQLKAIIGSYPVLNDPSHALTQTVNQAYNLMVANGYPAGKDTLLDAAKTAIADRKDIVVQMHAGPYLQREASRFRQAAGAQGAQMGASHRADQPSQPHGQVHLSQPEIDLARRMNIKDPGAAKVRFLQRQQDGRSSLGAVSRVRAGRDLLMSSGGPMMGRKFIRDILGSESEAQPEVLGTVKESLTDPTPQTPSNTWTGPSGRIDLTEPPPPWELRGGNAETEESDARRYVEVPDNWELHWINPRLLESAGWRYWQAVMASDERVHLRVPQMQCPDGTIRRGGATGDILSWMYKSWADSRRKAMREKVSLQTANAMRKQEQLQDEFARGRYGPYLHLDKAQHPTHTIAEGSSIKD